MSQEESIKSYSNNKNSIHCVTSSLLVNSGKDSGVKNFRNNCSLAGEAHLMGGHVEGVLFGIGNPLLDLITEVPLEFLQKYKVEPESCVILDKHPSDMVNDILAHYKVVHLPGGASQNALRVAQWLIGVPYAVSFLGCISNDEIGQIIVDKAKKDQVKGCFVYTETEPTGKCVVALTGNKRTYITHLGAARHLECCHLEQSPIWSHVTTAKYFYFSGFPLINCPEVVLKVAKYGVEHDRIVTFNLSTPSICTHFIDQIHSLLPYVDVLFGNSEEAIAYAETRGLETTDPREIALLLARYPKENGKRGRCVVLTHGIQPTIVVQEGLITEYPVLEIDDVNIVDLNGGGDAFVGGFLAQLVQGGSMKDCIRSANYAADFIIQQSGCQLPRKPNFSQGANTF